MVCVCTKGSCFGKITGKQGEHASSCKITGKQGEYASSCIPPEGVDSTDMETMKTALTPAGSETRAVFLRTGRKGFVKR